MNNISYDTLWMLQAIAINLLIAIAVIMSLRFLKGIVSEVNTKDELAKRDNYAFGISLAGGIFAIALMMSGAMSGEASDNLLTELISIGSYSILGLILIKLGRFVQDKLVFRKIALHQEIINNNIAAAMVETANVIAIGIVIRAAMLWVEDDTIAGLIIVVGAFVTAQILLLLVSFYRSTVYKRRNNGAALEQAFKQDNRALALRYAGHLVGTGLTVTATSQIIVYDTHNLAMALGLWMVTALGLAIAVSLISILARACILSGINVSEEVDQQQNIGVGAIEASIYITFGFLLTALLG